MITESTNNSQSQENYLHKDHLGSPVTITDKTGLVVQRTVYDPWGKSSSISGGYSGVSNLIESITFTGHESIDDLNIIHMNGRIYEPTLGRFLQSDPFIQAPKNSQNYNRYSYVLNSPLSYTDPSGYLFKDLVKIGGFGAGASWGGIEGGIAQGWLDHNAHKWVANSKTMTTIGGIVVGAVSSWWCGPCSIGFSALYTSNMASYNGASTSRAFWAGTKTGATAAVFYGIGRAFGAESGFWETGGVAHITTHALAGGIIADLEGGKFGHGFFAAGFTKWAGGYLPQGGDLGDIAYGTIASAVIGGTASVIAGSKFENGAKTAAFQYLFNQVLSGTRYVSLEANGKVHSLKVGQCANTDCILYGAAFGATDDQSLFAYMYDSFVEAIDNLGSAIGKLSIFHPGSRVLAGAGLTVASIDGVVDGDATGVFSWALGFRASGNLVKQGVDKTIAGSVGNASAEIVSNNVDLDMTPND